MQVRAIKAKQNVVREGDRPTRSFALLEGNACTYQNLDSGNRQIMAFHVPGDVPDLQSLHLSYLDHSVGTVGPCTVGFIDHADLQRICRDFPRIAAGLWRLTLIDACIFRAWISNLGARKADSRAAHLICETVVRMDAAGQVENGRLSWPVTQADLADALGISIVHVNRTLTQLRTAGLMTLQRGTLTVSDWPRLKDLGEFGSEYLHLSSDKDHSRPELN
ncbi:Crp/Fnr family transcriptional regulator [Chelativorans sp.]|uniref:Crp/Fnr family transcriptional regulator n=1 Tax=Chelativorans sp. TaxID=2203393 RepID=UPI0028113E1F|nr:Crp/Fnr family transcriptional regulator [Chelativorans sp.]